MCGCRRHDNTDAPCTCKCDHLGVVAKTRRYWKGGRGWTVVESIAVDNRPHVLIDAEDREQVERLADALVAVMCKQGGDRDTAIAYEVRSHMRSALREFANPTREVFEHLPVTVNDNGSLVAHCGKVWMPGAPGVVAVGKCPECMGFAESGWTA